MLKDRQWHLKSNQTIFLEFLETIKNLHVLMLYSYAKLISCTTKRNSMQKGALFDINNNCHAKNLHRKGGK